MPFKKVLNLMKFYKKNNQAIEVMVGTKKIEGKIIESPNMFRNSFVLKASSGNKIKVFLEDIDSDSIFPLDVFEGEEREEYKRKSIPKSVKNKLWHRFFGGRFKGECPICSNSIQRDNFEAGHIIAVAEGGDNNIDNLKPLCKNCNRSMGSENLEDFKRRYH